MDKARRTLWAQKKAEREARPKSNREVKADESFLNHWL